MIDVTKEFGLFSRALRILVPLFDEAGIRWGDEGKYDEFYDIADALFRGFITSKFIDDERYSSLFEPYRYDMKKEGTVRFIAMDTKSSKEIGEFIRFVSNSVPFDAIEVFVDGKSAIIDFSLDEITLVASC